MKDNSDTENVDIDFIDRLFLIIGDNLRSYKSWSTAFGENDGILVLESSQSVVNYFETFSSITLLKGVFTFKQNVFRLDVSMHNVAITQVFNSLKELFYHSSNLMRLKLLLLLPGLNLFVKCDSFQQLQHKIILVSIFKNLE